MSFHKMLQKQIQKYLNTEEIPLEKLDRFLQAVNSSYYSYERDRELSEHSFFVSEQELMLSNQQIRNEIDMRNASILKLKEVIKTLQVEDELKMDIDEQNLFQLANYLKSQAELRQKIEQELISAKEIAENAARAKSDFLSVMSHELRTPLNGVIGMTYLLIQNNPLPTQIENLKTLKFSAENLLVLINDILDFNKIEAGKIDFEEIDFDLKNLVNNIKAALQFKAEEKENRIRVLWDEEVPNWLVGDSLRIGQILTNLVSNAVKFTKHGTITIEVALDKKENEYVSIYFDIRDTGIGIPDHLHEQIFDRFSQAGKDTTRRFGGTGLGLSITKKLLEMMGSEIKLISAEGKGSSFSFSIRLKKSKLSDSLTNHVDDFDAISKDHMNLDGIKILIAEDNQINILVIEQFLRGVNASTFYASTGLEAVQLVKENQFDIVLMDLQMPEMDGYDATVEIRKFNVKIPIIALTASAMLDIRDRAFEVGMNDYVTKPFNPNELYAKIRKRVPMNLI